METKANYVLIGGFTVLTVIFLLLFTLWATKFSTSRDWRTYEVIFDEAVTGLTEGSSVQYNGLGVGTVESLSLDEKDSRKVIAILKLRKNTPIKVDTTARLSQQGITGVPFILLSGGKPDAPMLEALAGDDYPIIRTAPSALQNIADTANRLVARLDKLTSEENIRRFNTILANLDQTTTTLAQNRENIAQLIVNARDASAALKTTLATTNGAIEGIDQNLVRRLPALLDKLDATIAKLDSAAGNANAMISENRPAIRSFTNDGLGQVAPTLTELRGLLRELHTMTDRMENNPARYILGRNAPQEFDPK
ncbi:MlaD family protein [Thermomonas sp.]|uniref:MlaD family protein n=1 Tax=Thermomonas sp. TaxID=1971895 RepID=UPI001E0F6385|nr:MlaD family protein [Thermomonas sp.]MBZ0087229.1 MCE family protein [Thermomonas sp.]HRO62440.1 MlaD family protein [Thermomonas sp.]